MTSQVEKLLEENNRLRRQLRQEVETARQLRIEVAKLLTETDRLWNGLQIGQSVFVERTKLGNDNKPAWKG